MSKIASALRSSPRTHQCQMRTLALLLCGSLTFGLPSAHATPAAPLPYNFGGKDSPQYDRFTLSRFADDRGYRHLNITRDRSPTYGDRSLKGADGRPLLPVTQLELPRFVEASGNLPRWLLMKDRATGYLMTVCTGTGCQYRIPVIWTQRMLDRVAAEMARVMASCALQSAECELEGVERAMTIMGSVSKKLDRMTSLGSMPIWSPTLITIRFCKTAGSGLHGTALESGRWATKLFEIIRAPMVQLHALASSQWLSDVLDLYHRSSGVGTGAWLPQLAILVTGPFTSLAPNANS
jgi:hypothetical protein